MTPLWRRLFPVAALAVLALTLWRLWPQVDALKRRDADQEAGVSTSRAPDGALALAQYLRRSGVEVIRRDQSLWMPPSSRHFLWYIEPSPDRALTKEEEERLWRFLQGGGAVFLAASSETSVHTTLGLQVALNDDESWWDADAHALAAPVDDEARCVTSAPPWQVAPRIPRSRCLALVGVDDSWPQAETALDDGWHALADGHRARMLYAGGTQPVMIEVAHGRGRLYLMAGIAPFTNEGLRQPGAARFVDACIAVLETPRPVVVFDEWHHEGQSTPLVRSFLLNEPAGWAVLWAATALLAHLALQGRRFGRRLEDRSDPPPREEEAVQALADLFCRAEHHHQAAAEAARRAWARWQPFLARSERATPRDMLRALALGTGLPVDLLHSLTEHPAGGPRWRARRRFLALLRLIAECDRRLRARP